MELEIRVLEKKKRHGLLSWNQEKTDEIKKLDRLNCSSQTFSFDNLFNLHSFHYDARKEEKIWILRKNF